MYSPRWQQLWTNECFSALKLKLDFFVLLLNFVYSAYKETDLRLVDELVL